MQSRSPCLAPAVTTPLPCILPGEGTRRPQLDRESLGGTSLRPRLLLKSSTCAHRVEGRRPEFTSFQQKWQAGSFLRSRFQSLSPAHPPGNTFRLGNTCFGTTWQCPRGLSKKQGQSNRVERASAYICGQDHGLCIRVCPRHQICSPGSESKPQKQRGEEVASTWWRLLRRLPELGFLYH